MTHRLQLSPRGVDVLLGVGVVLTLTVVISAGQGGQHAAGPVAYLWALGLGALMLLRRSHPLLVLALTSLGLFSYYAVGYPAIGLAVPVAAALYSAAEVSRLRAAIITALVVIIVSVAFRLAEGQDFSFVVGYDLVGHAALMAAAIALGDTVRGRRAQAAQQRELTALTARQHAAEATHRSQQEKLTIARDLHDSVGHTVSVISLHAEVAREAVGRDDTAVSGALELIKDSARQAMTDLRRTVTVLRTPGENQPGGASLADLGRLVRTVEASGLAVEVEVPQQRLPPMVDAAAYRVVQEALTNVVRHSGASAVRISAEATRSEVHVRVTDNGAAGAAAAVPDRASREPDQPGGGHGITGMTERVEALGGRVRAGHRDQGFVVEAHIPLEGP